MPGDHWQHFANLRAYYGFMWGHPGKKLLFMGQEVAQRNEWNHAEGLPWGLLDDDRHAGVQRLVRDLNKLYREQTAPLISHYRDLGLLEAVEAAGTVEEIADRIAKVIG